MPGYVVVEIDVKDPAVYEEYKTLSTRAVAAFGGRFVVRGGACETLEGDWRPKRFVILEFPSVARAKEWWASDLYRPAREIREKSAATRMIVVEGVRLANRPAHVFTGRLPGEYFSTRAFSSVTRPSLTISSRIGISRSTCSSVSTTSITTGRSSESRRRWVVCRTLRAPKPATAWKTVAPAKPSLRRSLEERRRRAASDAIDRTRR